jgi:LysM repeat protein
MLDSFLYLRYVYLQSNYLKGATDMMRQKTTLTAIFILLSFLYLPSSLLAQTQEYKDYIVTKGDTLWDISKKELKDPFFWPKIWKENPDISNPDRIYPQQKVRIPLSLLQKEITLSEIKETKLVERVPEKETVGKIEPPKKEYLVGGDLLIASGYIADSVQSVGSIVDSPTGRTILGVGDYAYVKTDSPAKVGVKFYVIRPVEKVIHPKSGKMLGYLIEVLGIAEIVGQDGNEMKIKIIASYSDIFTGSLLDSYYELEPPYRLETPRKPDIDGYIVAAKEIRTFNGMLDIVYLDKGRREGLEVGDVCATLLQGKHRIVNSVIQVINTREATATAIVRKSNNSVTKGDEVVAFK